GPAPRPAMPPAPFLLVFRLEIRQRPVERQRELVAAERRLARELGMSVEERLDGGPVVVVIRGGVEPSAGNERRRHRIDVGRLEEPSLLMPLLRPTVGIENVVGRYRALRNRATHERVRIDADEADVVEPRALGAALRDP